MTAPDKCHQCRSPLGHPSLVCPVCEATFDHYGAMANHIALKHGYRRGGRGNGLLVGISLAGIRGWPTDPLIKQASREGFLPRSRATG